MNNGQPTWIGLRNKKTMVFKNEDKIIQTTLKYNGYQTNKDLERTNDYTEWLFSEKTNSFF